MITALGGRRPLWLKMEGPPGSAELSRTFLIPGEPKARPRRRFLTVSPSCPAVPFMGGVTSTSTLELLGRFLSVGGETRLSWDGVDGVRTRHAAPKSGTRDDSGVF